MNPGGSFSLADLRRNPSKIFDVGYRLLFLPYSILFTIYIISGVATSVFAYIKGWPQHELYFKLLPVALAGAILLWATRLLLRYVSNVRARGKSRNPRVQILDEINSLTFEPNDVVEFKSVCIVKATRGSVNKMTFNLGWGGKLSEVATSYQDGCSVTFAAATHEPGIDVEVKFAVPLPNGVEYPFGYGLKFQNRNQTMRRFLRKISPYLPERQLTQAMIVQDQQQQRFMESIFSASNVNRAFRQKYVISSDTQHSFIIDRPIQGWSYMVAVQE